MKLHFDEASAQIIAGKEHQYLVLDLDDGTGPFSKKLLENGLSYRLIFCHEKPDLSYFTHSIATNAGEIYFSEATKWYLDQDMQVRFNPHYNVLQLFSESTLLEFDVKLVTV